MYKAVIIEDEPMAAAALKALLHEVQPALAVAGTAGRFASAVELVEKSRPELLFLDVQLADCSGFDVLHNCRHRQMEVIFTTAYDCYAIQAFETLAIGYLLKPVDEEALRTTLGRALTLLAAPPAAPGTWEALDQRLKRKWAVAGALGVTYVDPCAIAVVTAGGAYSHLHFTGRKPMTVSRNIGRLERELSEFGFVRCHRSALLNPDHVVSVSQDREKVFMANGMTVPLARSMRPKLLQRLGLE